jgi:LysR family transcriptional regulator, glycine cleavage system transcriptional activator
MRLSRSPHLRNLRAFCVAAHHRSFKVAADELHLTPSAVSHQMKELEDTLGVRLFERKTRAVELTSAGHALYDEISPLLDAIERSLARIARRSRRTALRLQLPPFFASELFIPRIGSFCDAYPQIDIQVDTNDPRPAVHAPASDLSVLLSDEEPQGLAVTRLFSLSLVAACAPHHAATVARLGGAALRELALIVHKTRPFAWNSWAQEVGLKQPEPKNVIELDSMLAVVRAAERGVGIALVPETLCRPWFDAGALARVFPVRLATADTYFLVSRVKDAQRPEVHAMTQWMIEHCTQLPTANEAAGAQQALRHGSRALAAASS